ncbi:hypothetical protein KBD81_00945 [Candidatus Woesebacteria bacterium]|nr:hypothetical protein [Candidatus Woesebacteria bacterium]
MAEFVRGLFIRYFRGQNLDTARRAGGIFEHGKWGDRYAPSRISIWRGVAQEQGNLFKQDPVAFQQHLIAQPPAQQYKLLELVSQQAFGEAVETPEGKVWTPRIGEVKVGDLYAGLIRHHFSQPDIIEGQDGATNTRRQEFIHDIVLLTIPDSAILHTVRNVIPSLAELATASNEFIPYMKRVVKIMSDDGKKQLIDNEMTALTQMGIKCEIKEKPFYATS